MRLSVASVEMTTFFRGEGRHKCKGKRTDDDFLGLKVRILFGLRGWDEAVSGAYQDFEGLFVGVV